ncbi:MAG TPA: hypothetical protein DCL44_11230 [Elusimicrobia bacterium]|nr:hypothetical protein [Elusimicrobiota bacterium]
MKRIFAIMALMISACKGPSYAAQAPDFKIAKVLNAPVTSVKGLKDLKGKVVFLDFWATWCAPCVASLPHINRLHEALKGEPVVFIAVTDESTDTITAFLTTHEIKSWVGIDQKESSFKAYRVNGRPDGYLIGKDGTLLARIFPASLEEKEVRDAIAGNFKPKPVEWEDTKAPAVKPETVKTIFEIKISSGSGKWRMSSSQTKLEMQGVPFLNSIARIWDVEDNQVILDTKPVDSLNLTLKTPPDGIEKGREVLKTAIQSVFNIRVMPEPAETNVFVLTLSTSQGAPRPKPGAPEAGEMGLMAYGGGDLVGTAEMPRIARALWSSLDRPVVDETGLKGTYEFDLKWKYGDLTEADRVLAGQGLILVPARRTIEFLRVTPAK